MNQAASNKAHKPGIKVRGASFSQAKQLTTWLTRRPQRCRQCGRRLQGDDPQPARHQVTELPPERAAVTEYRRHTLCCQTCGVKTEAEWGEDVPSGSFGARLQATVAYLTGRLGLSHRDVIGAAKHSIITTDRHLGYSWLATTRRQICWAHLKRDFQAIAERGGESQELGEALLAQTKEVFRLWHEVTNGTLSRRKFRKLIAPVQQKIKELLETGSDCGSSKTRGTCRQIRTLEDALWTFVRAREVEPTNNEAERALRRAVLWRRKSFGTQSEVGSRFVERILTVVTSLRQQGRNVLEYLTAACASVAHTGGASVCAARRSHHELLFSLNELSVHGTRWE